MTTDTSRWPIREETYSRHKLLIGSIVFGLVLLVLARFWVTGPVAGMFGVWGGTLIFSAIGGHLLLRLWTWQNR